MVAALVLAAGALVSVLGSEVEDALDGRLALAGAAVVAGAVGLGVGAWLFRRRPSLVLVFAFATLPIRIPLDIGGDTANLLLPLYAVIACGVAARCARVRPARARAAHAAHAHARAGARGRDRPLRDPGDLLDRRRGRGQGHLLLLRPLRAAVPAAARPGLDAAAGAPGHRPHRRPGADLRRGRDRRVRHRPSDPRQREGPDRQRAQAVLPRQQPLLRPQHLRALPGADHGAGGRADAVDAAPAHPLRAAPRSWRCCGWASSPR